VKSILVKESQFSGGFEIGMAQDTLSADENWKGA
jgi:hypothetical protein